MTLLDDFDGVYLGSNKLSKAFLGTVQFPCPTRKYGASQSTAVAPWQVFNGFFGQFIPANNLFTFTCDQLTHAATFPALTTLTWNVLTHDTDYLGIEGYMQMTWGNYDDSVGGVTPRQVKNITALSATFDWVYSGSGASGLLCECWLSTTAHATGPVSSVDAVAEVGFFPRTSPHSQTFATSATLLGTFTDVNSITWNVSQAVSGVSSLPYYFAWRTGFPDHHGALPFKELFGYLRTSGKLTGNEYFNGLAFGAEIDSDVHAANLAFATAPTVTYTGTP